MEAKCIMVGVRSSGWSAAGGPEFTLVAHSEGLDCKDDD